MNDGKRAGPLVLECFADHPINLGWGFYQIAKRLHIGRPTVSRYLNADEFPERAPRACALCPFIPNIPYLQQRWVAGCHNARQRWREL